MKKITFLVLHLGIGGIETSILNTCNGLSDKYKIQIISFYNLKKNIVHKFNKNITIKYLYNGEPNIDEIKTNIKKINIVKTFLNLIEALDIILKKRKLVKREIVQIKEGVIVSTRMEFNVLLNKYGRKEVIKIGQEHQHHNNNRRYIQNIKNKYRNLDYLLALTKTLKQDYELLLKNTKVKVVLIPNMLEFTLHQRSSLSFNNIINVGRMHKVKRITLLLEVLKLLPENINLILVGDGKERKRIEQRVKELNLENRVRFTGFLSPEEVNEEYLKSDLFVMTSKSEGLPMVLLEAMNFGLPCIAFRTTSGIPDIIKNNYNGYIIDDDDIKEMANKIKKLISNKNDLKLMGKNAEKTSIRFSKDRIIKEWQKLIEK